MVPPKGLIFTGAGDFVSIGDKLLADFINLCHLKPSDKVLDVGCGIGRVARPLTTYLDKTGSYYGFDIVEPGVKWCTRNYSEFPNFVFHYVPLKNDLYNLSTNVEPSNYTFPLENASFDFVAVVSVFTHMQEAEVKRYLSEISRVLKTGKFCFCTFFLITTEAEEYLKKSKKPFFKYRYDDFFLHNFVVKDANVAYRYETLEKMIAASNLKLKFFFPGWWASGIGKDAHRFQDVLVIEK